MSHRQSCDRCRQQKVRCRRDETERGSNSPSSGQTSLSQCERCTRAAVDCVYSLKQRPNSRSFRPIRRDTNPEPKNLNSTSWLEQGIAEALYPNGSFLGADVASLVGRFPGTDEARAVAGFEGWDANLQSFSPTSLNSLAAPSGVDAALVSTTPSITDDYEDSEDIEDDKDPTDVVSSQLTSLSKRATRAIRHLDRPGRAPLTVSSPEVNVALEDTNTLLGIITKITSPDRGDIPLDSVATNYGLVFLALACHQHLVALFRAICDAIHRCLQSKKEHQQQQQWDGQDSDVGPSSVAQFVMVLQLLMHLINRIDRSLFQDKSLMWHGARLSSTGGHITPITPDMVNGNTIDPLNSETAGGGSHGSLLVLVHDIVGKIPNEHDKLRRLIQELQTEMEHSEHH
ncbi:hypothetical protein EV127DRAFT_463795 [Xylaria flabelliformis]|nr:hypothetical protein EV127DRAFT_463795 [Xylaria flabelliformis]